MKTSESIIKIAPAFLKAQQEIESAKKNAENPFFHSNYANLGAVIESIKKALNNADISVLQPIGHDEQGNYVETILIHVSGEYYSGKMLITPIKPDPQAEGSAITYARRYGLSSMCLLPSEDDDGEDAMQRNELMNDNQKDWLTKAITNLPSEQGIKLNQWLKKPRTRTQAGKMIKKVNSIVDEGTNR